MKTAIDYLKNQPFSKYPYQHTLLDNLKKVSQSIAQWTNKTGRYFREKQLTAIANLDTRHLVFHLSPLQKLQVQALHLICDINPAYAAQLALQRFTKPRRRLGYRAGDLPTGATPFVMPYGQGQIRGYSWGEGQRTVYLVHGWESQVYLMSKFVEPLLRAGFRIVAFDAPGHGHSDTQHTNVIDYSQAIAQVIRHMGKAHSIIAHSCGGAASVLMLKNNPDITPSKVVLVATMPSLQKHIEVFQEIAKLPTHVFVKFVQGLEQHLGLKVTEVDAALASKQLNMQALIIHDLDDHLIPHSAGYWLAKNWPGAQLKTTTDLGHLKILQSTQVISTATTFLEA